MLDHDNIQEFLNLFCEIFVVDSVNNWLSWPWMLKSTNIWQKHSSAVSISEPYIPSSSNHYPRNPTKKLNSGYKAWEFLLYIFSVGPCLMSGVLPLIY